MKTLKIKFLSFILLFPLLASAQFFNTDVFVKGSIGVGFDVDGNEVFGFDTQRFKEANIRIHFDDTSDPGVFPNNDWRILINDTNNGGSNYFAIEDATAGTVPLLIEADNGDIGMGTEAPETELHIVDGNTPTIRIEQDGSNGWTSQTWDLAGNESNFFIANSTNGQRIPFTIKTNAPEHSMYINNNGNVTLGAQTNDEKLLVKGNIALDGDVHFKNGNSDAIKILYDNNDLIIRAEPSETDIILVSQTAPVNTLHIHESGAVSIGSDVENRKLYINGGLTVNGDIQALSDRRLKKNIAELNYGLDEILELSPKKYDFVDKGYEDLNLPSKPQIGFIAQEVQKIIPELVTNNINVKNTEGEHAKLMGVNYTSLIPVLVQAIQDQNQRHEEEIASMRLQMEDLNTTLNTLLTQIGYNNQKPSNSPRIDQDDSMATEAMDSPKSKTQKSNNSAKNGRSANQIQIYTEKGNE